MKSDPDENHNNDLTLPQKPAACWGPNWRRSDPEPQTFFRTQTADPLASQQSAWQQLENLRQQQASALAHFDSFWIFAALTFVLMLVVIIMKRSVAEKGAHLGSE